jgi:predicted glycoside hydrolase/deacetylase ChbG (UPF0249 family)
LEENNVLRRLIVNADDFGLSSGVNDGILEAHVRGIVTSTSLMVRAPFAAEAVERAALHPSLSIGLHLDLGEWAFRSDTWVPLYEVVSLSDRDAVTTEVHRQIEAFIGLVGSNPTHVDSHQHVHAREPVRSVASDLAAQLGVPLRHVSPEVTYCGNFYGQTADGTTLADLITAKALTGIISSLAPGTTELACHPGYAGDLDTMYREERAAEVAVLCDPRVRKALEAARVELVSFGQLAA